MTARLLLLAGSMLVAGTADAATYLRYTITSSGSGQRTEGAGASTVFTPLNGYTLEYVVPFAGPFPDSLDPAGASFSAMTTPGSNALGAGRTRMTARAGGIDMSATGSGDRGIPFAVTGFVCGATGGTLPTAAFTFDPSCSTLQVDYGVLYSGFRYTGGIDSIAVAALDGEAPGYGVTRLVPSVPEPATWMLMLAGMAITGAALRRRRTTVRCA